MKRAACVLEQNEKIDNVFVSQLSVTSIAHRPFILSSRSKVGMFLELFTYTQHHYPRKQELSFSIKLPSEYYSSYKIMDEYLTKIKFIYEQGLARKTSPV